MNPNYKILFEPVQIGPVTAPNRFYQVPHASGMTEANPRVRAAFRATKAEGGSLCPPVGRQRHPLPRLVM
jgi:dimethylamine/trimethylamine dehydrogenase